MTAGDIIALVGIALGVAGPAYAMIWHRLNRIEDKMSARLGNIHSKLDDQSERLTRVETLITLIKNGR